MDKYLLIIGHAPSPNTQTLLKTINDASNKSQCIVTSLSAFETTPEHIIQADAVILFTPENLSYMSGAMKDMFDRCYYPVLNKKQGLPVAAIVRAGHDGTGTVKALQTIITGLRWRWVQEPLVLRGDYQDVFNEQVSELAEAMSIALEEGII